MSTLQQSIVVIVVLSLATACNRNGDEAESPSAGAPGKGTSEAKTPKPAGEAAPSGKTPAGASSTEAAPAATGAAAAPTRLAAGAEHLERGKPAGKPGDPIARPGAKSLPSGLRYVVLQAGSGNSPKPGARVELQITGWLQRGTALGAEFWDTRRSGQTRSYRLDSFDLIPGCVEALLDMKAGERRWLVLPQHLGYGARGYGTTVPPGTGLVLDVELVSFR